MTTRAEYRRMFRRDEEAGHIFAVWAIEVLRNHGMEPGVLQVGYENQTRVGETTGGYEFKFDRRFGETGRLFIETQSRFTPEDEWIDGGPYKAKEPWYAMGCAHQILIFATRDLVREGYKRKDIVGNGGIQCIDLGTARGFLLFREHIEEYAKVQVIPTEEEFRQAGISGVVAESGMWVAERHPRLDLLDGPRRAPVASPEQRERYG